MATIAVLALQGAFIEHEDMLHRLGAACFELRKPADLNRSFDGLVLPGGESTVQGKLLRDLGLFEPLRSRILNGLPVLGTCAGLILLARTISGEQTVHFGTLPVTVKRNAYGRQLGSFYTESDFGGSGPIPMTFIRAPYIEQAAPEVAVLAETDGKIVGVQYRNQIAVAFHPELDHQFTVHQRFLALTGNTG